MIPLDLVGAISGIVGTLTGVISLIWHLINNRSKLILYQTYFERGGFGPFQASGMEHIGVRLSFRNKGAKPTTVEEIFIIIGNHHLEAPYFKQFTLAAGSSKKVEYTIDFMQKDFENIMKHSPVRFEVNVSHTFGYIKKTDKVPRSWTGYLTIP